MWGKKCSFYHIHAIILKQNLKFPPISTQIFFAPKKFIFFLMTNQNITLQTLHISHCSPPDVYVDGYMLFIILLRKLTKLHLIFDNVDARCALNFAIEVEWGREGRWWRNWTHAGCQKKTENHVSDIWSFWNAQCLFLYWCNLPYSSWLQKRSCSNWFTSKVTGNYWSSSKFSPELFSICSLGCNGQYWKQWSFLLKHSKFLSK